MCRSNINIVGKTIAVMKKIVNDHSSIYLNYGYLMLPISLDNVPKVKLGTEIYYSKTGYHVSLINLEELPESDQNVVLDFAKTYPVKLKKITSIYRTAQSGNYKSIIVDVQISGLKKMISAINTHFGYHISYPPTHITLFIPKGQEGGVALNTVREYQKFTNIIDQVDSSKLSKSFKLIS